MASSGHKLRSGSRLARSLRRSFLFRILIDGEVVALDEAGRPSFNALQNYGASKGPLLYYVFDVLTIRGREVTGEPLSSRREMLDKEILPKLPEPIRVSAVSDASLPDLIYAVKAQGLEGLVAKRKNRRYESDKGPRHGRRGFIAKFG